MYLQLFNLNYNLELGHQEYHCVVLLHVTLFVTQLSIHCMYHHYMPARTAVSLTTPSLSAFPSHCL